MQQASALWSKGVCSKRPGICMKVAAPKFRAAAPRLLGPYNWGEELPSPPIPVTVQAGSYFLVRT